MHHIFKILLCVGVSLNLLPVAGSILVILPHPRGDRNIRDGEAEPREEVHEIACHMLDTVHMADDDQSCNFVMNHPVSKPGVLVLDAVHPLDEFLDKGRVVIPPDR